VRDLALLGRVALLGRAEQCRNENNEMKMSNKPKFIENK
jgi:hypothetical protein